MSHRRFGGGESFKVHHADHNRWQQAGDHFGSTFGGNAGSPLEPDEQTGVVLVKNTTGRDLPRFSILTLYGSISDPTYGSQENDFKNLIALKGIEPTSTITGRFCILQDAVRDGETGPALVSGVAVCRVKIESLTDEFCDIETDNAIDQTRYLESGSSGSAQILFRPEMLGEQWGYVRLGNRVVSNSIKLIRNSDSLPAAFGGPSHLYDLSSSGGLVESYGNYVAGTTNVKRLVYPKQCTVWTRDSDNYLSEASEVLWAYNPGGLPLPIGWYWAEADGDLWRITGSLDPFSNHSANYRFLRGSTADVDYGEAKFVYGGSWINTFSGASGSNRAFTYLNSDVFITHPGTYKITFGGSFSPGSGSDETTTNVDSGGDTVTRPRPRSGHLALWKNFNPDLGDVTTQDVGAESSRLWRVPFSIPPDGGTATVERTIDIQCKLADWHGGPYTRLNLSTYAFQLASGSGGAITCNRAWIGIQAVGDDQGYFQGPGYNAFLGSSGAFQWYGGGPAPAFFDEDGVWIP